MALPSPTAAPVTRATGRSAAPSLVVSPATAVSHFLLRRTYRSPCATGQDHLHLTVVKGYLRKLITNERISLGDGGQNKLVLGVSWPRSRSRLSLRMRFRCANRISIFFRSRRDCSKPSVPANDRATSRACSWMSRGILRAGSFGQHCGLSGQPSQSSLLARYRSVLPSCTVPLVPSCFPPGQN